MWVEEDLFTWFEVVKVHLNWKKGFIWVIWGCIYTFELKRASLEWYEGTKPHLSCRGYDLSDLRCKGTFKNNTINWTSSIIYKSSKLSMQRHIWKQQYSLRSRTYALSGLRCKGTFEFKRIYLYSRGCSLSGLRVETYIWEQKGLI